VPPASLGATPPPPVDQLEQLLAQVRAPTATPQAVPAEIGPRPADPHEPGEAVAARPRERAATARRRAGAAGLDNVLVVDPDPRILGAWTRAARGRNLATADDAVAARQLVTTRRPDLAIVELRLGNTSGIDLIREIKRELPEVTAVLCSGYLSAAAAVAAVRAGADIVVFKPITFREILERLQEHDEEPDVDGSPTISRADGEHIARVLADCSDNVSMAARRLGIYRSSRGGPRCPLTAHEHEVLKLVAQAKSTIEIARELRIDRRAVEVHRQNIMDKLEAKNAAEAIAAAYHLGLIELMA
jgi:two-component system response regulator RegA